MFFRYYQLGEKREWVTIEDSSDVEDRVRQLGAKKLTILAASVNFNQIPDDDIDAAEEARESCSYKGPLYFDIDYKGELDVAIDSAKALVFSLLDIYHVAPEAIKIFCSGSKGMHIIVHQKAFSKGRAVRKLPKIYKEVAKELYQLGVDFQVYSEGRGVSWRLANIQRDDGKYRVEITLSELETLTVEKYKEFVAGPRQLFGWPDTIPFSADLASLFETCKKRALKEKKPVNTLSDEELDPIKSVTPNCVEQLCSGKVKKTKNFNEAAMQLGVYLARTGADRDRIKSMTSRLADSLGSSQYSTPVQRQRHAYGVVSYLKTRNDYKFSCAAMRETLQNYPCEGCPISNGIQESIEESLGIFEGENGYYVGTKEKSVRITNFTINVEHIIAELPEDGSAEKRTGFLAELVSDALEGGSVKLYMNEDMWASRSAFIKATQGYGNLMFQGSEQDVQKIKALVFSQEDDMGKVVHVHTAGIILQELPATKKLLKVYVEPGYSLTEVRTRDTHTLLEDPGNLPRLQEVQLPDAGDKELNEVIEALMDCNSHYVTSVMLGWFSACHLKTHITYLFRQFPLLLLWGSAGSGKTSMAELFHAITGVSNRRTSGAFALPSMTPFPILYNAASTTTIPRIFDEYNEAKMDRSKYNIVSEILKAAWNQQNISRGTISKGQMKGRTGATTVNMPVTAPIIYISEQSVAMPALQQRSVQVMVSRESRQGCQKDFKIASRGVDTVLKLAKAMMFKALATPLDEEKFSERIDHYESLAQLQSLDDRPRYGYAICLLGLDFLKTTLDELNLPAANRVPELKEALLASVSDNIEELEAEKNRSEVDIVIEDMLNMMALSESKVENYVKEGSHYVIFGDKISLYLPLFFAQYKRYAQRSGNRPLFANVGIFLKLLRQEPYFLTDSGINGMNPQMKMTELSLDKLIAKGIAIPFDAGGG